MSEHPVLACYSGLDSTDAVQLGARLATVFDQPLVLVRAYEYEPVSLSARALPAPDNHRRAAAAAAMLRHARTFVGADVEIREQIVPAAGIVDALVGLAVDLDACLLVVGRDSEGHVTRSLLPRAPCPVLVAALGTAPAPADAIERIGSAYDGSRGAQAALVAATALARAAHARLVVVAAGPTTEHAEARLRTARLSLSDGDDVALQPVAGEPRAALSAASADFDVLVCGSRGRGRPLATLLGSVSTHLAAHARCALLVVPPGVSGSGRGPLRVTPVAT
jgi:nucleotide-binding universal stress UspA family protein